MKVLLQAGADLHAVEEQALRAAACFDGNAAAVELLLDRGADASAKTSGAGGYSVFDYPCMTLAPAIMQLLIDHGARPRAANAGMIIAANERRPREKAACIEVLRAAGFEFPDTAPMALHRRDRSGLSLMFKAGTVDIDSRFSEAEIFPDGCGIRRPAPYAYVTPLSGGVTLLHMAVEFCDTEMAAFLLAHGADVNARSDRCAEGYGGWTPLFHAAATLHRPRRFADMAELLLRHGADPAVRASIRKPLADASGDWAIWRNLTAVEFARGLAENDLVNEAALELIAGVG